MFLCLLQRKSVIIKCTKQAPVCPMTAICTTYPQKPVAIPLILLAVTLDLIVKEDIQQLQPPVACCNLCEGKLGNLLMLTYYKLSFYFYIRLLFL